MENIQQMLSTTECNAILHNCFKQENIELTSYEIVPLSDTTEGFLGEHFIVKIEYNEKNIAKTHRCFMKILNGTLKIISEMTQSLNAYNKEKFFYTFLLPEFEKYHIDISFSPKGYFCKPYLIVLEDLSLREFKSPQRKGFLNLDQCKAILKTLAKFHSSSIVYEAAKTGELGKPYSLAENYPEIFKEVIFAKEPNVAKDWIRKSMAGVYGLIEIIPENHITKTDFLKKLKDFVNGAEDLVESLSKYKCTILHNDLWLNNVLFKYNNEFLEEAALIDYQLVKYGPPSQDVIHMIFCNTRKEFREKHLTDLLEFYYECLNNRLSKFNLKGALPKEEYLQLCVDLQILVKILCLCDRCLTFMPEEMMGTTDVNDEVLRDYLFENRAQLIVDCFSKGGEFKELIEEDVLELRDMLFRS